MKEKVVELAPEKIELIERLIKSDRKFSGNEDLLDDFKNEACKRSFLIVKSVSDITSLEAYLKKIVATSLVVVLKDLGRVRRTQEGFVPTYEVPLDTVVDKPTIESLSTYKEAKPESRIKFDIVDVGDTPEELVIKKELLNSVMEAISIAHKNNLQKQYMQLFDYRYVKSMKQSEIAKELNISQGEVSKRLLELMELVKKAID